MKKIVAIVLSLVMVLGLATTAFAATTAQVTFWSLDAKGAWVEDATMNAHIPVTVKDLDDLAADEDNFLPSYYVGDAGYGDYYVEVAEAAATNKLTYGAKTVFLKAAGYSAVYFDVEADVFTNVSDDATECGTLYIANLDDEDVYYASYSKTTKSYTYYVGVKSGPDKVLLVDGKLVKADVVATELNGHDWLGNDVVNYEYTTVKCEDCGKVAMLYANATAAGKYAVKVGNMGWITLADATDFGAVVEAPAATDKVESAQTFDAGIAMYVGMSVMAAAGSAVVLKKKD